MVSKSSVICEFGLCRNKENKQKPDLLLHVESFLVYSDNRKVQVRFQMQFGFKGSCPFRRFSNKLGQILSMLLEIFSVGGFEFFLFCLVWFVEGFFFVCFFYSCCSQGVFIFLIRFSFLKFRLHEVYNAVNDRNIFARHLCDYT